MKKIAFILLIGLPMMWSCSNNENGQNGAVGENDVDAARMFIRSALDGKWKQAKQLVIQDSMNMQFLELAQNDADTWDVTRQRGYREAQIRIHQTHKLSDSVSIITYSNTFKNERDSIKVVNINGQWLVDLKYFFQRNNAAAK